MVRTGGVVPRRGDPAQGTAGDRSGRVISAAGPSRAPVLAMRSHFFEFQEVTSEECIRLVHELDLGGRYRVIVTTSGGLVSVSAVRRN